MNKASVLIVEDDLSNIQGTIALLENRGIRVDVAGTVQEASKALSENTYELLLIDWTLPLAEDGPSDSEAGAKLVQIIQEKRISKGNHGIKYFIITKQTDQFANLPAVAGARLGILSKLNALAIVKAVLSQISPEDGS